MAGNPNKENQHAHPSSRPDNIAPNDLQNAYLGSFTVENMAATLVVADAQGIIQYINPYCTNIYGYSQTEMAGTAMPTFWATPQRKWSAIATALENDRFWQGEIEHFTKEGHTIRELASISSIKPKGGGDTHLIKTGQPIQSPAPLRKQAANRLNQKDEAAQGCERSYRQLLENSVDGYFEVDLTGNFTYVNEAACRFMGHPREKMLNSNYRLYVQPEEARRIFKIFNEVYRTGKPSGLMEYEINSGQEAVAVNQTVVVPLHDESGEPIGFCGVVRDLTDLKKAQNDLKTKEEKYRSILANLEEGYYEIDLKGNLTDFNNATCISLGREADEIRGMNYRECVAPASAEKLAHTFERIFETGQPVNLIECELVRKDGTRRFHQMSASLLKDPSGKAVGFFGVSRDRSDEIAMERALRESEASYRGILEMAPDAISINDADTSRYIEVNDAFCQQTGYSREEVIGRSVLDINLYADPEDRKKVVQELRDRGRVDKMEVCFRAKDGTKLIDLLSARIIEFKGMECLLVVATMINPLMEAQEAIRESEKRLRDILDAVPSAISLTTFDEGTYVSANRFFYERTGYTPEETIGRTSLDLDIYVDPDDRHRFIDILNQNGLVDGMEIPVRHKDGSTSVNLWSARVVEYNNENHLLVAANPIDDLKAAQQALTESEESYRRIMEMASSLILITRASNGRIVAANQAFCERTGYSSQELIGRTPIEMGFYTDPDNRKRWIEKLKRDGKVENIEMQFLNREGAVQDDLFSAQFIRFKGEDCVLSVITSITSLKKAQRELQEKEEGQRAILDTAPYAIAIVDQNDLRYRQVNNSFCSNTGYDREEIIGHTAEELNLLVNPTDRDTMDKELRSRGLINGMQIKARRKDGAVLETLISCRPMTFEGRPALLFVSADITELKKAQRRLRDSEEGYRTIIESVPISMAVIRQSDNRYVEANETFCRRSGCTREEYVGHTVREINFYENRSDLGRITKALAEHGRLDNLEIQFREKSGKTRESLVSITPVLYRGEACWLFSSVEITDMKKAQRELDQYRQKLEQMVTDRTRELEAAQRELVKREKLSVLGQLTATVSHELRNPLGVIRSSNFYLQRKSRSADKKQIKHYRRIEEQVTLCDTIVADLLEYTRGRSVSVSRQRLGDWMPEVIEQMTESEEVRISLEMAQDLPPLSHDREKMRRVMINVLDNASQAVTAMAKEAKKASFDYHPEISVKAYKQDDDAIVIRVVDNGIGMDDETCRRAFEPLFTTRARGTGIGLANVKKIIEEHGGQAMLQSRPEEGTEMRIILPCGNCV